MTRRFFTPDDDRQILTLRAQGLTHLQIATQTGLNFGSVHSRIALLKKNGVRTPEDVDSPDSTVRRNFTPEDANLAAEMRSAGASLSDISRRTGFALGSISRLIKLAEERPIDAQEAKRAKDRRAYVALHPFNRETASKNMVRCLGGCGQMFESPDRLRIRICKSCKNHHKDIGSSSGMDDYRLSL